MGERWTWDGRVHHGVASALARPDWCDRLERDASDAVTGKVLCVCAALAVARLVVGDPAADPHATQALDLLAGWIDDPTDERFDRICDTIFGPDPPDLGPYGVGWRALRTATSSVGNGEAGWALGAGRGPRRGGGGRIRPGGGARRRRARGVRPTPRRRLSVRRLIHVRLSGSDPGF